MPTPDPNLVQVTVNENGLIEWARHGITAAMSAGGTFSLHKWLQARESKNVLKAVQAIAADVKELKAGHQVMRTDLAVLKEGMVTKVELRAVSDEVQNRISTHINDHATGKFREA
jgi:hypothetical protein